MAFLIRFHSISMIHLNSAKIRAKRRRLEDSMLKLIMDVLLCWVSLVSFLHKLSLDLPPFSMVLYNLTAAKSWLRSQKMFWACHLELNNLAKFNFADLRHHLKQ